MSRFGDLIKRKRGARSQDEVAKAIGGVTQPQLGRWERGESHPGAGKVADIIKGFQALDIPFSPEEEEVLRKSLGEDRARSPLSLLTLEGYLKEQQEFIVRMRHTYDVRAFRICFLGTNDLPVTSSEAVDELWINNLRSSISYCIFWCIDALSTQMFDRLESALTRISVKLGREMPHDSSGKIRHYPVYFEGDARSPQRDEYTERYRELQRRNLAGQHFHDPDDQKQTFGDLLPYYQCFGNTVTYLSMDRAPTPLTALILNQARLHVDTPPRALYLFLDEEKSRVIAESLRAIMQRFDARTSK
jgi:transcriptional regulator with XRE-family HTH domain